MADLVVTAASVSPYAGATKAVGVAGEAFTAGHSVYQKASDKKWYKDDNDNALADYLDSGVALSSALAAGVDCFVCTDGDINPGATVVIGESYYTGAAAGGIAPCADVINPKYPRFLGMGITASKIRLTPQNPGVARAA